MCNLSVIKIMAAIVSKVTLSLITRNHLVSFSCFSSVVRPVIVLIGTTKNGE